MDEEPAMEPVLQSDLQIKRPALITPGLNFFDLAAIRFRHPEFHKTESVVRISTVAEAKPAAAARLEVWHDLIFEKGGECGFRFWIGG